MGRTERQNSRKRIQTFYQACTRYNAGERRSPPRLRVTLPNWEAEARRRGVEPKDVFDDFSNWAKAQKIARDIGTTPEQALESLWNRHRWRIQYRDAKRGIDMVDTIKDRGLDAMARKEIDPLAPRLFLNKYKGEQEEKGKRTGRIVEQTEEERERIIKDFVKKFYNRKAPN